MPPSRAPECGLQPTRALGNTGTGTGPKASLRRISRIRAQRLVLAHEPLAFARHEHRAALHRRLVDVQRDGDVAVAGVADGVVLVRRDQAAGAAGTGVHAAGGAEVEAFAVALEQFVLDDFQFAVPHAFHAPQAGMVVHRRALARAPGHGDHAVAEARAAVELAARVVVGDRLVDAGGQLHVAVADHPAQRVAQAGGDLLVGAGLHGLVDRGDELVVARKVKIRARVGLMRAGYVHMPDSNAPGAARARGRRLPRRRALRFPTAWRSARSTVFSVEVALDSRQESGLHRN